MVASELFRWVLTSNNIWNTDSSVRKTNKCVVSICAFILFFIRAMVIVATHFSCFFTRYVHRCIHPCYCRFVFVCLKPFLTVVATSFHNQFYSIQSAQCRWIYVSFFLSLSLPHCKLLLFFICFISKSTEISSAMCQLLLLYSFARKCFMYKIQKVIEKSHSSDADKVKCGYMICQHCFHLQLLNRIE